MKVFIKSRRRQVGGEENFIGYNYTHTGKTALSLCVCNRVAWKQFVV